MTGFRIMYAVLITVGLVAVIAMWVAWATDGRLTEAAEEHLGSGAACGRPDHETVLCVHEGRRYLCVRGRSGTTACAEAIGGVGGPER